MRRKRSRGYGRKTRNSRRKRRGGKTYMVSRGGIRL